MLQPKSTIDQLSWNRIRCDNVSCPDAVAFSTLLTEQIVIQYEADGGLDKSPLDDWTHWGQMFQRPALYQSNQTS